MPFAPCLLANEDVETVPSVYVCLSSGHQKQDSSTVIAAETVRFRELGPTSPISHEWGLLRPRMDEIVNIFLIGLA